MENVKWKIDGRQKMRQMEDGRLKMGDDTEDEK